MDRKSAPSLLPILRSQQQGELLYVLLRDAVAEFSVADLERATGVPYASVHREVERAEAAGLVVSRRVGRTRVLRANAESPYYRSLVDLLTKAFGPVPLLADALKQSDGVEAAFIFGSWAAASVGQAPGRPVGDIDVLVLGEPDREALYLAISDVEAKVGRPVQIVIRDPSWLEHGSGAFHANVTAGPMISLGVDRAATTPDA